MAKNRNKNYRFSGLRTTSSSRNLGPSASNLGYTYTEVVVCSIAVDRHTYRVLYITRPSQNLKNLKICPERPRGPIIDDLERRYRRIIVLFLPHRGCDTLKGFCSIADTVESDTAWTSHQQAAASRQPIGFLTCQPFTFVRENLNRIRQAEELARRSSLSATWTVERID